MSRKVQWRDLEPTRSDYSSRRSGTDSERSYCSHETAPTEHSVHQPAGCHQACCAASSPHDKDVRTIQDDPTSSKTSIDTYASTVDSFENAPAEPEPEYELAPYTSETFPVDAVPATPSDFAQLFPSSRTISIRHDDATVDGNMNLRLDTRARTRSGKTENLTLFHLRMHDLKERQFSLRRYCRDSGREVCHSSRRYSKPAPERPGLQRSFSSAFATFRSKAEAKSRASAAGLARHDSGYASVCGGGGGGGDADSEPSTPGKAHRGPAAPPPTNAITLEFANYAHIDVKRCGARAGKRYEFEFWGTKYAWKRVVKREGVVESVSYHLVAGDADTPIAFVVPEDLSPAQAREEVAKGGWVPPCCMWIEDRATIESKTDISE